MVIGIPLVYSIGSTIYSELRRQYYRFQLAIAPEPSVLDTSQLEASLGASPNILFLCHGNICRSPLAERYLATELSRRDGIDAAVASAGLQTENGKQSPPEAVSVAAEHGVSLADHGATETTVELLRWSDVIFIKDISNYILLRRRFGDWEDKSYFLGALLPADEFEIRDPYGGEIDGYRSLYADVVEAVDTLVELLVESQAAMSMDDGEQRRCANQDEQSDQQKAAGRTEGSEAS